MRDDGKGPHRGVRCGDGVFFRAGPVPSLVSRSSGPDVEEPWDDEPELEAHPIEPGTPAPENVAFLVLGVLAALFVLARIGGLV